MRLGLIGAVVCLLFAAPCALASDQTPEEVLERAEYQFRQQQFRQAVTILLPIMQPKQLLTSVDSQLRARELLAASYYFLDETANSRQQFTYLLLKRPAFVLDEFIYPVDLQRFLKSVRADLVSQGLIPALEDITKPKDKTPPSVMRVTDYMQVHTRATAFMPFGVAQFEYGEEEWGIFFATSQGLSWLANLGTGIPYLLLMNDRSVSRDTKDALYISAIASLSTAVLFYVWGVIDGNVRHEPIRMVRREIKQANPKEAAELLRLPQPHRQSDNRPVPTVPGGSPR